MFILIVGSPGWNDFSTVPRLASLDFFRHERVHVRLQHRRASLALMPFAHLPTTRSRPVRRVPKVHRFRIAINHRMFLQRRSQPPRARTRAENRKVR